MVGNGTIISVCYGVKESKIFIGWSMKKCLGLGVLSWLVKVWMVFFYSAGAGYEPVCAGGATHRHARDGRLMKTKGLDGGTHNKTNGV